jgi:hypothetical protein
MSPSSRSDRPLSAPEADVDDDHVYRVRAEPVPCVGHRTGGPGGARFPDLERLEAGVSAGVGGILVVLSAAVVSRRRPG